LSPKLRFAVRYAFYVHRSDASFGLELLGKMVLSLSWNHTSPLLGGEVFLLPLYNASAPMPGRPAAAPPQFAGRGGTFFKLSLLVST